MRILLVEGWAFDEPAISDYQNPFRQIHDIRIVGGEDDSGISVEETAHRQLC